MAKILACFVVMVAIAASANAVPLRSMALKIFDGLDDSVKQAVLGFMSPKSRGKRQTVRLTDPQRV